MRIAEMTFPKDRYAAGNILMDRGYKHLGNGYNANVFYKEGQKSVLKIFNIEDVAYAKYVDFCLKNQDKIHFPKFSRGYVEIPNTDYRAVRTEMLYPCEIHLDILTSMGKCLNSSLGEDDYRININYLRQQFPESLIDAIDLLREFLMHNDGLCEDVTRYNIMTRGSTTLVFTDPIGIA